MVVHSKTENVITFESVLCCDTMLLQDKYDIISKRYEPCNASELSHCEVSNKTWRVMYTSKGNRALQSQKEIQEIINRLKAKVEKGG